MLRRLAIRRLLRLGALSGVAATLFLQAALAIAACAIDGQPSRGALLAMQADMQREAPCHEEAPASDALCAAHCQASDPSLDKSPAQPAVAPLLDLAPLAFRVPAFRSAPVAVVAPHPSPPARILFQTLLI